MSTTPAEVDLGASDVLLWIAAFLNDSGAYAASIATETLLRSLNRTAETAATSSLLLPENALSTLRWRILQGSYDVILEALAALAPRIEGKTLLALRTALQKRRILELILLGRPCEPHSGDVEEESPVQEELSPLAGSAADGSGSQVDFVGLLTGLLPPANVLTTVVEAIGVALRQLRRLDAQAAEDLGAVLKAAGKGDGALERAMDERGLSMELDVAVGRMGLCRVLLPVFAEALGQGREAGVAAAAAPPMTAHVGARRLVELLARGLVHEAEGAPAPHVELRPLPKSAAAVAAAAAAAAVAMTPPQQTSQSQSQSRRQQQHRGASPTRTNSAAGDEEIQDEVPHSAANGLLVLQNGSRDVKEAGAEDSYSDDPTPLRSRVIVRVSQADLQRRRSDGATPSTPSNPPPLGRNGGSRLEHMYSRHRELPPTDVPSRRGSSAQASPAMDQEPAQKEQPAAEHDRPGAAIRQSGPGAGSPLGQRQHSARHARQQQSNQGREASLLHEAPAAVKSAVPLPSEISMHDAAATSSRLLAQSGASIRLAPCPTRFERHLLATVEDQQAVRAVSFHPSGDFVAIGSNSQMLRIASTHSFTKYGTSRQRRKQNAVQAEQLPILWQQKHFHRRRAERSLSAEHQTTAVKAAQFSSFKRGATPSNSGSIYCVEWNDEGTLLATGSNDKHIRLLRFNADHCELESYADLKPRNGTVRDARFHSSRPWLLSGGGGDMALAISDVQTGQLIRKLDGHSDQICALSVCQDTVATASLDATVRIWDLRQVRCAQIVQGRGSPATAVDIAGDGDNVVVGAEDGSCLLYNIKTAQVLDSWQPHETDCRSAAFCPWDPTLVLSSGYDGSACLSATAENDRFAPFTFGVAAKHNDKIIRARWHPSASVVATTSVDRSVKFWWLPQV